MKRKITGIRILSGINPLMIVETKRTIIPFFYDHPSILAMQLPKSNFTSEELNGYVNNLLGI